MKKSLLFALALGAVFSANAQGEYRDDVYTVVGQHGNRIDVQKGRCQQPQPRQPQFYIEDNTQVINGYDDVIENESSVKNVLVRDYQTINYYHENVVKEVHHYPNGTPAYRRAAPRRAIPIEQQQTNYEPVQSFNNYQQVSDGSKWFFFFQLNSDFLTNQEEIGHLIDYALSNPRCKLYIDSYADALTGSESYNMDISQRRANTIINILIREGVNRNRLFVKCHGCINQPYNTNNLNRCVTVKTSTF